MRDYKSQNSTDARNLKKKSLIRGFAINLFIKSR